MNVNPGRSVLKVVLRLLAILAVLCAPAATAVTPTSQPTPSEEQIAVGKVVNKYGPDIMKIPGVWGVGGYCDPDTHKMYVGVSVENYTPEIQRSVPLTLGGFPVFIEVAPRPRFL